MAAKFLYHLAVAVCLIISAAAQDEIETCYGPGSIVGAIIGTILISVALLASCILLYKMYWRSRRGKHLVLVTDTENPGDQYAFDNPCFREATPIKHSLQDEKQTSKLDKTKWLGWSPLQAFATQKNDKITSLDDSYVNDVHLKVVTLKSHDFTGLGFNICGNMRDGIFVKDVLHRGPAFESGCINSGDRIDSVRISFRNMVFEDALTILSYASPYEVQVHVENDSCSRPSTLIRSKRESHAVSSAERIRHPKYNRSQSISDLAQIGRPHNKRANTQTGYTSEKNRINQSLNKCSEYQSSFNDYPTLKLTSSDSEPSKATVKSEKNAIPTPAEYREREIVASEQPASINSEEKHKFHKFGIKVLPITINPKMGIQSMTKKPKDFSPAKQEAQSRAAAENEKNSLKNERVDETDGNKDNVKAILTKGFQNLKEKINHNTLGKKKKEQAEGDNIANETITITHKAVAEDNSDCPVPKARSTVACGVKAYEQNQSTQTCSGIPEEVTRAGDVARNHRKSASENILASPRKSVFVIEKESQTAETSSNTSSSERDSPEDVKRPKRSKGKAPAPPQSTQPKQMFMSRQMNEIKKESDVELLDKPDIFEPMETDIKSDQVAEAIEADTDSDSDSDEVETPKEKTSGTKIELNATQVTIHHSPTSDNNDEEIETSRKAASLGDLSKLDSDHSLSVVLERAVSLDLADGSSQCGKKRKAPLPPPEEFPAVFDDVGYRKEPRLEHSLGLNTFQRRLKKSSDFGTLEDALQDGPKSLDIEVNKTTTPHDLLETYNSNIQEFSSWLAECRKPKTFEDENGLQKTNSTSLININADKGYSISSNNVIFSVNGKHLQDLESDSSSRTVLVISQPNSLEPIISESIPINDYETETFVTANEDIEDDSDETPPKLPTSPMPVLTPTNTLSSPLSSSLTYITEIKVSTSEEDTLKLEPKLEPKEETESKSESTIELETDSRLASEAGIDLEVGVVSSTPITKRTDVVRTLSEKTSEDSGFETSKIPIRTMKSETGQKVLATIQSLAAKGTASKTPEVEYAKRVASLFQSASPIPKNNRKPETGGFYLKTPGKKERKKIPPVVPPRKVETTLSSTKSMIAVEAPDGVSSTLISDSATTNDSPRISWNENLSKELGAINGGHAHIQVQTGVVNLPVKTSATKITFENKDLDNEEF